jgi:DNA-binding protein YbaB
LPANVRRIEECALSADMDRLAAEFTKFQAKIKQAEVKFQGVAEMREQLTGLEAVATSPDRTVRVTAGAGGAVTDIQLAPGALSLAATELSATIMSTLRAAVAEVVRRQAAIVDETVGEAFGISTTDQVNQAQAEALGTGDLPAHGDPTRPRRGIHSDEDDDDYSQNTVYRQ